MPLLPQDDLFLTRALILARDAAAFASPNPTVGCILALHNEILGEGAHLYDNRDHAEIVALKQTPNPAGATAYVTLEPCAHHGRTGPCADALIAARIARCVIATVDPNPLVSGQGIARLRAAHIDTLVLDPDHPLAEQARRLNDAFAFAIQHNRPFVTLKAALSADAKLAPVTHPTGPHWLTGPAARADAQHLRHASDAILTGIGTVLTDNPSLTDRTGLPRRRPLLRIVLDTHLRTPPASTLVTSANNDLLILCAPTAPTENETTLTTAGAEVLRLPTHDLPAVLDLLTQRHIRSLLLESGSGLNGAFLRANLVDKLVLYLAQSELGPDALPFAAGIGPRFIQQQQLTATDRTPFPHNATEDLRITTYLHDPWSTL